MQGTPFGRYQLTELLGRGGMGEVWRAYDTSIERTVAIKTLLPHFAQDHIYEERFRREARAAARLDNPHIVPIYDVGEIDGRLYVAMKPVNGQDLETLIADGPLSPERAIHITEQVASALHAAHKVGLVHRDVKPSNILVAEEDFAYLIDFGIARATGETALTANGATIGTWSYMAPERFSSGGETRPSSDIYALACVLYQSLTGQLPFAGDSMQQIAMAHMTSPPPKPSTWRRGLPATMDDVVATGLAKDPQHRYQTTKDLAGAARTALITAHRPSPSMRPAGPARPASPVGPAGPARQVGPVGPVRPVGPVGPARPVGPVGPARPVGPSSAATMQAPGGVPRRPVSVAAASIIAVLYGGISALLGLGSFRRTAQATGGSVPGWADTAEAHIFFALVYLLILSLMIWGAIAAWRGTSRKILTNASFAAVTVFVLDTVRHVHDPTPTRIIGFVFAGAVVGLFFSIPIPLLRTTRSIEYFNARSGSTIR